MMQLLSSIFLETMDLRYGCSCVKSWKVWRCPHHAALSASWLLNRSIVHDTRRVGRPRDNWWYFALSDYFFYFKRESFHGFAGSHSPFRMLAMCVQSKTL